MKKNICVYCSSSNNLDEKYYRLAQELGHKIASKGYGLVYGGTIVGCMGQVANAVIHNGGEAIGVIPELIESKGLGHPELAKIIITKDMRERKATMEEHSNIFLANPGGFGTFEEIFEILVAKQLGYHKKAVIFLNLDDYYTPLFQMFENIYREKFAKEQSRELYYIADSIDEVFDYISTYEEKDFIMKW